MNRERVAVAIAVSAAILVTSCAGGSKEVVTVTVDPETAAQTSSEGEATEAATLAGLTPDQYQARLDKIARRINRALEQMRSAPTWDGLIKRTERAHEVVSEIASALGGLTPPPDSKSAHASLVDALGALTRGLATMAEAVQSRSICAAPAAAVRLSRLDASKALLIARRELRAAGYRFPRLLPEPLPELDRGLPTGTYLVSGDRSGTGELRVSNGRVVDGVVVLAPVGSTTASIAAYVSSMSDFTITGIPDGTYRVSFTYGNDWDEEHGRFTRKCDFSQFDDPTNFVTKYEAGGYTYSVWEISLDPVAGGTARTSSVDPNKFPELGT